jgi:superfamily II DNA/RNA helicase
LGHPERIEVQAPWPASAAGPLDTFSRGPRLCEAVCALGYAAPTPIQQRAIPTVLDGRDVIGLTQTGTGRTAAFAPPIL